MHDHVCRTHRITEVLNSCSILGHRGEDGGGGAGRTAAGASAGRPGNGIQPAVRKSSGMLKAHETVDAGLTFTSTPHLLLIKVRLWKI